VEALLSKKRTGTEGAKTTPTILTVRIKKGLIRRCRQRGSDSRGSLLSSSARGKEKEIFRGDNR